MSFIDNMKQTMDDTHNYKETENGALAFRTTGKELLDLNFAVASLRGASDESIAHRFMGAFFEDRVMAMKWLFFCRDIRGGLGERKLFRAVINHLSYEQPKLVSAVLALVPEYGRYDDLWSLLNTMHRDEVVRLVVDQLDADLKAMEDKKPVSLLGKWMPSENTSSPKTVAAAKILRRSLQMTPRDYRRMLSKLRAYINIVERQMSNKEWGDIKYEAVPSRANLIYNGAFLRNDEERRRAFLAALEKGETKINAGTLFPHDIVHKYASFRGVDATLENLWKALPDTVQEYGNTIVVADGSGSMTTTLGGGTGVTALEVANALAIYFAERSSGQFKDNYITFSERPQLVDLSGGNTLRDKLAIARRHSEVANTNIEAVFNLILETAMRNRMEQKDLPANILIISDMEFDSCASSNGGDRWSNRRPDARLFAVIAKRYEDAGYKLPRIVFWNVNSRTGAIPVKENDLGVALVSGFSVNIAKMVMSGQTDPYLCLVEQLNDIRYAPVEVAIQNIV